MNPLELQPGDRVAGTYFGHPFTGTVESRRLSTTMMDRCLVFVELDTPIVVFDLARRGICCDVRLADARAPQTMTSIRRIAP